MSDYQSNSLGNLGKLNTFASNDGLNDMITEDDNKFGYDDKNNLLGNQSLVEK